MTDEFVQPVTFILILACIVLFTIYSKIHTHDRGTGLAIYLYLLHSAAFYFCILFLPWENFSFTHWSRWFRLHEFGTLAIILYGLIVKHRKMKNYFRRANDPK